MKRLATIWVIIAAVLAQPVRAAEETVAFGRFGDVTVYRGDADPRQVVLFIGGDGGWNQGVVEMARSLAGMGAMVVGVDILTYLKKAAAGDDDCTYAAGDFETLSHFIQKKYALSQYRTPVLIGYSSGATLAYATLVQAPTGMLTGAISLGFCPDIRTVKPLCRGRDLGWRSDARRGAILAPSAKLEMAWVALHGEEDQVCGLAETRAFVSKVANGRLVTLPKVGHGFSVQKNWMPQLKQAFKGLTAAGEPPAGPAAGAVADLPLVEVAAKGGGGDAFAVVLSGDGGWASFDRSLGDALSKRGVPVVGFNSLSYFWSKRTPEEAAVDLGRVIDHYSAAWRKERVMLIGYSFGAEVLPFVARRLLPDRRARVAMIALLGPSATAEFEFHVSSWLGGKSATALPLRPEIDALAGMRILCVFGTEESDSLCRGLNASEAAKLETKGGHHFGGDVEPIVDRILMP